MSIVARLGVAVSFLAAAHVAAAQTTQRSWREAMQLDAPLLAAKRLENVRGIVEEGDWDAAVAALAELADEFPNELVGVSPGRYLNVAEAAQLLTLQFPAEGLAAYRRRVDGWAQLQFLAAVEARDDSSLRRLVKDAFASSVGDDALNTLAQWAWERGEVASARRLWTQMIPLDSALGRSTIRRYPDTDHELADVHSKLILCSLAEGDLDRASSELSDFTDMFPDAAGTIAGQEGSYVDLLERLLDDDVAWQAAANRSRWSTFGAGTSRNSVVRRSYALGGPEWSLPLKPVYVPKWEHPRVALPERGVLARYPVLYDEGVFFHDGATVYGLELKSGRPLWPLEGDLDDEEPPGKIYPTVPMTVRWNPWTPIVGLPRLTTTIHNGRLYALLGPSVLTVPPSGRQVPPMTLVRLNLEEGQGLMEWSLTSEQLFGPEWTITSTPVAEGEFLYVTLLKSTPQLEVAVACLRAADGQLCWQTHVGQALRKPLGGRTELGARLLTLADGRLYLATDFGAIAALDARSGNVSWVVTYPSIERSAVARSDESSVGLLPPLVDEGVVYVKPNDAEELLALDAETGFPYWRRRPPGQIVHLLGVADSSLLVSGDQLWALDVGTGRTNWRFGYDDVAGQGYGRGAIVGDRVFWPTREELVSVDLSSGRPMRRIPLTESLGVSGGHLLVSDRRLLISGRDHLTALTLIPEQF